MGVPSGEITNKDGNRRLYGWGCSHPPWDILTLSTFCLWPIKSPIGLNTTWKIRREKRIINFDAGVPWLLSYNIYQFQMWHFSKVMISCLGNQQHPLLTVLEFQLVNNQLPVRSLLCVAQYISKVFVHSFREFLIA